MLASQAPTSFVAPFANAAGSGFIRTIPVTSQVGITNGAASLHDGFPPDCFSPVAAGGVPPFGQDFNGLMLQTTAGVQWSQVGGEPVYSSAFSTAIGGYPNGAILQSADGTGFWRSTADNNTSNPDTGGANWLPMFFSTSASIALTNANVTLSAAQYSKPIIVLTGTLTGNVVLTFPAFTQQWTVINSTGGAFSVTAIVSGGSAVTLAQGSKSELRGNGTNVLVDALQVGPATQPTDALQQQQKGFLSITTSQSWTSPFTGTLWVSGTGGGGGGGGVGFAGASVIVPGSSGGGAGFPVLMTPIAVTVGDVLVVTIGAAGTGGPNSVSSVGGVGGTTSIVRSGTTLLTLSGGQGGVVGPGGADNQAWPGQPGGSGSPPGTYGQDTSQFGPGAQGGIGGSGPFGGGGPGGRGSTGTQTVAGSPAGGFGAGGGGAGGVYGTIGVGATGNTGGAGAPGILLFQW